MSKFPQGSSSTAVHFICSSISGYCVHWSHRRRLKKQKKNITSVACYNKVTLLYDSEARPLGRVERREWRLLRMNTVSPFCNDVWNPKLIQMYDLPSLCLLSSNPAKPAPLLLAVCTLADENHGLQKRFSVVFPREKQRGEKLFYSSCRRHICSRLTAPPAFLE